MEPGKRKEQKGYAYNDIGKRLKEIREALNHTLDRMSVDSGISRSYLEKFTGKNESEKEGDVDK